MVNAEPDGAAPDEAMKRAGIREVVLPERNRRDVDEIPPALLSGLEIRYVSTIEEALERTLEPISQPGRRAQAGG